MKSPRRDMKRKENEKGLSNNRQIDLLGNKSLLEKRVNIRASDYRFEDKIKYYQGFVNSRGQRIGETENLELKNISNVYKKFGEKEIVDRTDLFIDEFVNLLDQSESIRPERLDCLKIKIAQKSDNLHLSNLAGTAGFEPANAGTKTQCLTTWRRPTIARTMTIIARRTEKIHTS